MSDFTAPDSMHLRIDASVLTPRQDEAARMIGLVVGNALTNGSMVGSTDANDLRERLWLIPYALLYSLHAAIEGCKALDPTGFESLRDGVLNRRDRNGRDDLPAKGA